MTLYKTTRGSGDGGARCTRRYAGMKSYAGSGRRPENFAERTKPNIAVGATAQSFYMTYGGTNWGWLGMPENYTSYDYGAAIRESRQLDPKYYEDKLIGYVVPAGGNPAEDERHPAATRQIAF